MTFWFTSDTHYGHANIIKYCARPFKSLYHMDSTLIKNHNSRVTPTDTVFFLGDFCFRNTKGGKKGEGTLNTAEHYISQLNGRFVFVRGNHDNNNSLKTCIDAMEITLGGKEFYLIHNPKDYHEGFEVNLCGHIHEKWKIKEQGKTILLNVGVDVWNYMPIKIDEILDEIRRFKKGKGVK